MSQSATMTNAKIVDIQDLRAKVLARREEEAQGAPAPEIISGIASRFISDCLLANELGDGMLYAEIHRGRFVFMAASKEWLYFNGVHWQVDVLGMHMAGVEDVVDAHLLAASELGAKMSKADGGRSREALDDANEELAGDHGSAFDLLPRKAQRLSLLNHLPGAFTQFSGHSQTRVPIVAVTGHAISGAKEKFLSGGMDNYIPSLMKGIL